MYEFLVRGDANGFRGAHVMEAPGDSPKGVTVGAMPAYLDRVNAAALARIDALEAELSKANANAEVLTDACANAAKDAARVKELEVELGKVGAELEQYKASGTKAAQAVVAVVNDDSVSDAQTAATCKAIALKVLQPVRERELEAAIKAAEEAAALVEALRAK